MTTYDLYEELDQDYPDDIADWYCNHDVPNGCRDCAWLRQEDAMLAAMTPEERAAYFGALDDEEGWGW